MTCSSLFELAMIAGLSSTTMTHPFDMLKTRIQLKPQEYPDFLRGAVKVLRVSFIFNTPITRKCLYLFPSNFYFQYSL